jgi:hypothetical protein
MLPSSRASHSACASTSEATIRQMLRSWSRPKIYAFDFAGAGWCPSADLDSLLNRQYTMRATVADSAQRVTEKIA